MKLHHTVNHTPNEQIAKSIEVNGLVPRLAEVYGDLVPLEIRHLPVVWLAEGIWQSWEFPVFEVNSEDLDQSKLHHAAIVYESDKDLAWWVYQGHIEKSLLVRL